MAVTTTCDRCSKAIDRTTGVRVLIRDLETGANLTSSDLCVADLEAIGLPVPDELKPAPAAPNDQAAGG